MFKYLVLILNILLSSSLIAQVSKHKSTVLMGCRFDITLVDKDSTTVEQNIEECITEISRIEHLISEWIPTSIISEVNKNAGIRPVKVPPEVFELTKRALFFSKITNGAFDISIVSLDKIWKFDGSMQQIPNKKFIKNSIKKVNYKNIILDSLNSTIFLKHQGMKIGFGATGKSYAAEQAKALMLKKGVPAGIINASGDIAAWGLSIKKKPWIIGILNPFSKTATTDITSLKNEAIVTSGSYEKFALIDGKRYSHIINPKTGFPSRGLISVTIKGPNAEFANGLSTSVMVLGEKKGIALTLLFPNYQYYIITDSGKILKSKHWRD